MRHSNQIFSQVFLPFMLAFAMVALAGYFLFSGLVSGSADLRMSSDISVMIVFLPLILLGPAIMAIILLHIVLAAKVQQKIVELGKKIKPVFFHITKAAANLANLSTKPLIALKSGIPFFIRQK